MEFLDTAVVARTGTIADHIHPRELVSWTIWPGNVSGTVCMNVHECYCAPWQKSKGTNFQATLNTALQWVTVGLSAIMLVFYAWRWYKATCGWEEVYVCLIEMIKIIIEAFKEFDTPCYLYLSNGNRVFLWRYAEWLFTCPVILIHMSNLTGLTEEYNKRTMALLVSDVGTICFGLMAAASKGYVKWILFLFGLSYGSFTFFQAAKVYMASYHTVPKGPCRTVVKILAFIYFSGWSCFPILFLLGEEGFGHMSPYVSSIFHTILDIYTKNMWGLIAHHLRFMIHEHVLLHGDIRVNTKVKVAGEEMEVQTMLHGEDAEEMDNAENKGTGRYAHRESFHIMRDRLKEQGFEVRASLGGEAPKNGDVEANAGKAADAGGANKGAGLVPGRVILAVPDVSMVDFFRQQFAQMPAMIELVPALGVDNTVALVQQAMNMGGVDFVLAHPDFLRDRSPAGLQARMRMMNMRICAFGWSPMGGPVSALIEGAGLDGWLEGPSFGTGINKEALTTLVARMQAMRRNTMSIGGMGGMGMMGMNGMGGMQGGMGPMSGGMGGMQGMGGMGGGMGMGMNAMQGGMGMNQMQGGMGMMNGMQGGMGGGMMMSQASPAMQPNGMAMMVQQQQQVPASPVMHRASGGGTQPGAMMGPNGMPVATNPLFGSAPSPMNSQMGGMAGMVGSVNNSMNGGMGTAMAQQQPQAQQLQLQAQANSARMVAPAAPAGASEVEMLQQLMGEINRLKSELGDGN